MKHLKKYNETTNTFTHDPDMELIKDIILELKQEYSNLEGVIVNRNVGDYIYTEIKLSPLPIFNENCIKIANIEKRMKFFNLVIECAKRLEDALDRKVIIENLFHESLGTVQEKTINIMIDDIKNKGVKWK